MLNSLAHAARWAGSPVPPANAARSPGLELPFARKQRLVAAVLDEGRGRLSSKGGTDGMVWGGQRSELFRQRSDHMKKKRF